LGVDLAADEACESFPFRHLVGDLLKMSGGTAHRQNEPVLQQVATGDQSAVERCMDQYGGLVWSLARRMMSDMHTAEDAVQDIFIEVWKNAGRYDPTMGSEATFIATIARRRLIDRLRKSGRRPAGVQLDDAVHSQAGGMPDSANTISEEAEIAREVIDDLGDAQKEVLQLSIFHGLTHERIADATGIPLGTVKTHARRGLIKIRQALGANKSSGQRSSEVSA